MSPLVDMTRRRVTGPVRAAHPVYVDLLPPCNNACPAGEDIQGWLALAQAGKDRRGLGASGARQPDARGARPGLLPPVRNCLQSRRTGQRGQHPRVERYPRRSRHRRKLDVCR